MSIDLRKLEQLIRDQVGTNGGPSVRMHFNAPRNASGATAPRAAGMPPESRAGFFGTIGHGSQDPTDQGKPMFDFNVRYDDASDAYFLNGQHVMRSVGSAGDDLQAVATVLSKVYKKAVSAYPNGDFDHGQINRWFGEILGPSAGTYADPTPGILTPAQQAKISSERRFASPFNPQNLKDNPGEFMGDGQYYASRSMNSQGFAIDRMAGALQGGMVQRGSDGSISVLNTKAEVDPMTGAVVHNETKLIKHWQKSGTGDSGVLIDRATGAVLPQASSHFYRQDPVTNQYYRETGQRTRTAYTTQDMPEGMYGVLRPMDLQYGRLASVRGPRGSLSNTYNNLPNDPIEGRHKSIPGLDRTTGDWDLVQVHKDQMQVVNQIRGHTSLIPVSMRVGVSDNTAQGHFGNKGLNVDLRPGAYGAPAEADFVASGNNIKYSPAFAESVISAKLDSLIENGVPLKDAVARLGLGGIYNTGPQQGINFSPDNYDAIRKSYQGIVSDPANVRGNTVLLDTLTKVGRFGAWQWGNPAIPAEDVGKYAHMDPRYYKRLKRQSVEMQDIYSETIESGVAMNRPGRNVPRAGIPFNEDLAESMAGIIGRMGAGKTSTVDMVAALGQALSGEGLSKNMPLLLPAQVENDDGTMRDVELRLGSYRNQVHFSGQQKAILSRQSDDGWQTMGDLSPNSREGDTITKYSNLNRKLMEQRVLGGKVEPADAKEYMELSEMLSTAENMNRSADQAYPHRSIGGPISGDSAIPRNVLGLGPEKIRSLFGIADDDDAGLSEAQDFLVHNDTSVWYGLYPHLSEKKLLRLAAKPLDSIKGLQLKNNPYGMAVHPETQGQIDKDFDVDAGFANLRDAVRKMKNPDGSSQFLFGKDRLKPHTVAEIDQRRDDMKRMGMGDAETIKHAEDVAKYNTVPKLQAYLANLLPENPVFTPVSQVQSKGYGVEAQYKLDMGLQYNFARKFGVMTGHNEYVQRLFEPYYQSMLDKKPLSKEAATATTILKSLQVNTASMKVGEDADGEAIFKNYMIRSGNKVLGENGLNKVMMDTLTNLTMSPEIADKTYAAVFRQGMDATRTARFMRFHSQAMAAPEGSSVRESNLGMASGAAFGARPWNDSSTVGGLNPAIKAMLAARAKDGAIAGVPTGIQMTVEDMLHGEMGRAASSRVKLLSARHDSIDAMIEAHEGALVDDIDAPNTIPDSDWWEGVYKRKGFVKPGGQANFQQLSTFTSLLGINIPKDPAEQSFSSAALGGPESRIYASHREKEVLELLRDPGNGSMARALGNMSSGRGYQHTPISATGGASPLGSHTASFAPMTPQMQVIHDGIRLGLKGMSLLKDEEMSQWMDMDAGTLPPVLEAMHGLSRGQTFNAAGLIQATGLRDNNPVIQDMMLINRAQQKGIDPRSTGKLQSAVARASTWTLHQVDNRLGNAQYGAALQMAGGDPLAMQQQGDETLNNLVQMGAYVNDASYNPKMPMSQTAGTFGPGGSTRSSDPRVSALADKAFQGLEETLKQLTPEINKLSGATGAFRKEVLETTKPLEARKDAYLGALGKINAMEATADKLSGGDSSRRQTVMDALAANRSSDVALADAMGDGPESEQGGIGGWLKRTSQGRGMLGRFLGGNQLIGGIQMAYLSRLDRSFTGPALDATFQSAERESNLSASLAHAGYGYGGPTTSMEATSAYSAMQTEFQRQAGATWAPAVRGAANFLGGTAGGFMSIAAPTAGATLMGGYAGGLLTGGNPLGVLAGAAIGGIGTAITGHQSRQQYLAENPAFAASEAYDEFNKGAGSNFYWMRNGMLQRNFRQPGFLQNVPQYSNEEMALINEGGVYHNLAYRGAPRAEMSALSSRGRNEVAHQAVQRLVGTGLSDQTAQAVFQQNQLYYDGGLRGEQILSKMAWSGVDMDAGTSVMASVMGGSSRDYADQIEPFEEDYSGFSAGMRGTQSSYASSLASLGQGFTFSQGAQFARKPRRYQDRASMVMQRYENIDRQAFALGLRAPTDAATIRGFVDAGALGKAQGTLATTESEYGYAVQGAGVAASYGADYQSAAMVGNSFLGMGTQDAAYTSHIQQGFMAGNPNIRSMIGDQLGRNDMISRETGRWGGNPGLGLFTSTMGYGTNSPMSVINSILPNASAGLTAALMGTNGESGGRWGLQAYMAQAQYGAQMAGIGISMGNIRRDQAFTTGVGISNYENRHGDPFTEGRGSWEIEDDQRELSRRQQREQMAMGADNSAMSRRHYLESWEFNRAQTQLQRGWQLEDFAFQGMQMRQSRGWQQEDWSFERAGRQRNFGYQMEDFEDNIRYSTGRQRRMLERDRDRAVTENNIGEGRADTEQARQKTLWKLEDERFDVQKKRASELHKLTLDRQDMEKRHFLERNGLEEKQREKQLQWMTEREAFEDEAREQQRTQWELDKEASLAALGVQASIAAKMFEASEAARKIAEEEEKIVAKQRYMQDTSRTFFTELGNMLNEWIYAIRNGNYLPTNTYSQPGPDHTSQGSAAGYQGFVPTRTTINEFGQEQIEQTGGWLTIRPAQQSRFPSFSSKSGGGQGGGVTVLVSLDGKQIAAAVETRQGNKLTMDRKR